jgi:CheY-like chemotaxis protein
MRAAGVFWGELPHPGVRLSVWEKPPQSATIPGMPTVLVVDDHAGFRARARALLEAEGYDVIAEAPDGATAIAEAGRLAPDIVLLDVQLPDLDGFDVAARITGGEDGPMVLLTSSRDWSDSPDLIARSGARGFVRKDELSGDAVGALTG